MGDKSGKFEYAGQVSAEQVAQYLERIAAGLRAGHVALGAGTRRASFALTDMLKLEIEAEARDGKGDLALEISWRPAEEPAPVLQILDEDEAAEAEAAEDEAAEAEHHEDDDEGPAGTDDAPTKRERTKTGRRA